MIPKVIHYCWFGGNPLPKQAKMCIDSWKRYCPDYKIKEWNESNFDVNCCDYVRQAYEDKMWAFVADYARFWILYHEGGLYFDTDVELIKPIEEIVIRGAFMGCEAGNKCAPGLGLGANPGLGLYKEILNYYETNQFVKDDVRNNTVVTITTNILKEHGFLGNNQIEKIDDIYIYPPKYFCPINYWTGEMVITEHTISIHHYSASWLSGLDKIIVQIEQCKKGGIEYKIRRCISLPLRIINRFMKGGIRGVVESIRNKILN